MKLNVCRLGRVEYGEALALQEKLLDLRQRGLIDDTLLLLEHPSVLTLGVRGDEANILAPREELEKLGVSVYRIGRGGDVTYHGPGQIVGYPIMNLAEHGRDIKQFVWNVEEVFIRLLGEKFNIQADREEKKYTGVWVGDEKITAIGIAVKRWVTMHGFAFNVNTNLDHFAWINPCGLTDRGVTSLQKLLGHEMDFDGMNGLVAEHFASVFKAEAIPANAWALAEAAGEDNANAQT
jgi:lipoyl(octanoyl) transferase